MGTEWEPRTPAGSRAVEQMAWQALTWSSAMPVLKPDQAAAQIHLWASCRKAVESRHGEVDLCTSVHFLFSCQVRRSSLKKTSQFSWVQDTWNSLYHPREEQESSYFSKIAWPQWGRRSSGSQWPWIFWFTVTLDLVLILRTNELLGAKEAVLCAQWHLVLWSPKDSSVHNT